MIPNKYAGYCWRCKKRVLPKKGLAFRNGGIWKVTCGKCIDATDKLVRNTWNHYESEKYWYSATGEKTTEVEHEMPQMR